VLISIALGIVHLHSYNLVHRDLACRNILVSRGNAKVADFGMARLVDAFTKEGTTVSTTGPVKWMAPESLSRCIYSTASDVWTFGIVCYEMSLDYSPRTPTDEVGF
jgi:serine/threonine protein kinase